jgi:hypothetical protein
MMPMYHSPAGNSAMDEPVSKTKLLLARCAIGLAITLIFLGAVWRDVSVESLQRLWRNLCNRPGKAMAFRFILQPVVSAIAVFRDGVKDAKSGRSPYLWTVLTNPAERGNRLWEGVIATAQVILLGLVMDVIYQFTVLKTLYPVEAVIIAIVLAFVPYVVPRGPFARIALWRGARRCNGGLISSRRRTVDGTMPEPSARATAQPCDDPVRQRE